MATVREFVTQQRKRVGAFLDAVEMLELHTKEYKAMKYGPDEGEEGNPITQDALDETPHTDISADELHTALASAADLVKAFRGTVHETNLYRMKG